MATQGLPLGSNSRSSEPVGASGLSSGSGYSVTLPVLGSSSPRVCSPKFEYQTVPVPLGSTTTSCGSVKSGRGSSYSVRMTRVARPAGRGAVLSGNAKVGWVLRLMLARYLAKLLSTSPLGALVGLRSGATCGWLGFDMAP